MSSTRSRRVTTATLAVAAGAAPLINAAAATAQDATSVQAMTPPVTSASSGVTDALTRALPVAGAGNLGTQLTSLTNPAAAQQVLSQALPQNSMVAGAPLSSLPYTGTSTLTNGLTGGGLTSGLNPLDRSSLGANATNAKDADGMSAANSAAANAAARLNTADGAVTNAVTRVAGAASGTAAKLPAVGGLTSSLPGGSLAGAVPKMSNLGSATSSLPAANAVRSVAGNLAVADVLRNGPLTTVSGSLTQF